MSTTRFLTLIGLGLGAIWAVTSFGYALLAGLLALLGFVIGLVLEGRINVDLDETFGSRRGTRT